MHDVDEVAAWRWGLATVDTAREKAIACLETPSGLYRLSDALLRVGAEPMDSVLNLFQDWDSALPGLEDAAEAVNELDRVDATARLAPLLYPGKVACAGANYFDHLREMGIQGATKENQRLFFFLKPPRQAIVGEGSTVCMPIGTRQFDWEVELAAVIGRQARAVSVEDALSHVAAYTVAVDFSARDHNQAPDTFYKLDWVAGKAHDTCCPIGPRLVPASALAELQNTRLGLSVNGVQMQDGSTADMIYSIAEQVSILSAIMTLEPGDLVLTGTPAGVGVPRGEFLQVGDEVTASVEHVGSLSVQIQPSRY